METFPVTNATSSTNLLQRGRPRPPLDAGFAGLSRLECRSGASLGGRARWGPFCSVLAAGAGTIEALRRSVGIVDPLDFDADTWKRFSGQIRQFFGDYCGSGDRL
jgi:hypothetical protein